MCTFLDREPMTFDGNGYVAYRVQDRFRQRVRRDTGDPVITEKYADRFEIRLRTRMAEGRMTIWSIQNTASQISLLEVMPHLHVISDLVLSVVLVVVGVHGPTTIYLQPWGRRQCSD